MRKLSPAFVATSIVIAVAAGSACAATAPSAAVARPANATSSTQVGNRLGPTSPAPSAGSSSSTTTTAPATVVHGTPPDGSRSGTNSDSLAANIPIGATGSGFLGASDLSSTGTTALGTPGINAAASVNGVVSPLIVNGAFGGVTSNGEQMNGAASTGYVAAAQIDQGQFNGNLGSAVAVETALDSQRFDRAVNVVKRDRQRVGRNGQLLLSIAPRTNADRSREMPDDPPSPALTGSNSFLTRP
ncbi:MAG: hypothetical protein ACXWBQ_05720 [Usitatibacter sp.]